MTFMNLSGEAVGALARYYKVEPEEILLILDESALVLGRLKLNPKGSAGGHNGLANVIAHLNTQDIPRIRIGIGAARPGNMIGHVLSRFSKDEIPIIEEAYARAADAVECVLSSGFEMAMNRFNISDKPPKPPKRRPSSPLDELPAAPPEESEADQPDSDM
jgi:PTH1 family peptidyl-tRNA hydrolase